ncbi:MAG: molybdopterin-dependent oxidoreductase, partial [Caldisericia bacterium]|nr:molybdopterin-dependent oxidoreductase [Caldisericia bacterium]
EILGENGAANNIKLQKMKLGEPDQSGRRRPIPIDGDEEILRIDSAIIAIGQYVNLEGFDGIEMTNRKTIASDLSTFATNIPGVFAGGDAINNNNKIAIQSIGDGKKASTVMQEYLQGKVVPYRAPYLVSRDDVTEDEFTKRPKANRPHMVHLSPEDRKHNFKEIVQGFSEEQAIEDAKRCLECGCGDYYECKLIKYSKYADVHPERFEGKKHCRNKPEDHPFIIRNADKCILCGLCVRVCNDLMGITALGLVGRGFETIVQPDMNLPLKDTDCISCGQCISVCPTGALQEKSQMDKTVPIETKTTKSICPYCSVGCHIDIETRGDMIVRVIPEENSQFDDGILCVKGRFGYDFLQRKDRITEPLIRNNGKLTPVSWNEALLFATKKLEGVAFQYGSNSVAVSISDQWTTEEIYLANKFGKEVLKTDYVTNFNSPVDGIKSILSVDSSTNTLKELENTDLIVLVGSYTMKD